jgi:uncharacterized protein YrrD
MLRNTSHLKGLVIRATDGELGTVDQLYFDNDSRAIRYLTVETGGWPPYWVTGSRTQIFFFP